IDRFGGGDGLATFKQWNMTPDHFVGENHAWMTGVVDAMAAYAAWNKAAQALDEGWQKFVPYASEIPTQEITFGLMVIDMRNSSIGRGYSGFGAMPGYIMTTYGVADDYTLPRVKGATAHELHHNLLFAARPKNFMTETTVADYMIYEGLAESFAAELYGEEVVGYYVTDFDDSRLEATKKILHDGLEKTGFDVIRSYIFGDSINQMQGREQIGLPDFAGYAIGYRIVQQYLQRTGKSVVEATFVPADEIIAVSEFFA
ncbi:MAG: hypothetical protein H7Y09_07410, partial [Chitinophagaceae bacterium]|nr:hypothetical protein [Anaerolineae bacterium]